MKVDSRTTLEVEATRSMHNRKPYRTKEQKEMAKRTAYKGKDGAWHSTAPTSEHTAPRR